MIRRLKEDVVGSLPPKLETLVSCPLAPAQLFWYRRDRSLLMISARVTYDGGHFSHRYRATPSTRGKVQSLILRRQLTTAGAFLIRPPDGRSGDPHVSGATRSVEPEAQLWEGPQLRGPLLYLPPLLGGWHPARPQHLCEAVRLEIAGFTVSRRG